MNIGGVIPLARAPATCEWMDPLMKEMIYVAVSITNNCGYCIAPGAITCFTVAQVRSSAAGSLASTFQKLLT